MLHRLIAAALLMLAPAGAAAQGAWETRHAEWTPADERGFANFVQALGQSDCRTVDACLRSTANPFRHSDPANVRFTADCADFPYLLRGYYAWKHGLPFSYASGVAPADRADPARDIRYTWRGNRVTDRRRPNGPGWRALREMTGLVSTAVFRLDPRVEPERHFHDLYPVAITRDAIRPGTVLYDPRGHVAVVYSVEDDGRVLLLNAHPDNSVTRTVYGPEYTRQEPELGGGFHNWRPQRLEGAQQTASGALVGGRILAARNNELPDFSLVQYVGTRPHPTDWRQGTFAVDGRQTDDFHAFVRRALMTPGFEIDPLAEIGRAVDALCRDLHDRVEAVDLARRDGLASRPQPARLPRNIYGAEGDWETYSTPGRDARLRASFVALDRLAAELAASGGAAGPSREALLAAYDRHTVQCEIAYTNSRGGRVVLSFGDVINRLFALSFDPHHCPELRWGASGDELATCPDGAEKRAWYDAQLRLRHVTDRDVNAVMGWDLGQLRSAASGPPEPPTVDPRRALSGG
jgi:hypothetical protein